MTNKASKKSVKKQVMLDVVPIISGMAMGPAYSFRKMSFTINELDYPIESIDAEIERFRLACQKTLALLIKTKELSSTVYDDQFLEIFESQIALLDDRIFLSEIETHIRDKKSSAAMAVFTVFREKMDYFMGLQNEYFRERAMDIQDLKHKILHAIFGVGTEYQISVPSIIFADYLSPSDTVHFNRNLILGFVTDTGGRTSHAAIVARSLNLPYVINNQALSKIVKADDFIILDAHAGHIIINPAEKTVDSYNKLKKKYTRIDLELKKESSLPTVTQDGVPIEVSANVEFLNELAEAQSCGAQGIGLFRTEGIFLEKEGLPDEEEQYQVYRRASEELKDQTVIIRSLDAGGDKILKELDQPVEHNPFLGWRAIRFCLDEKEIFKTQLRAILRANINNNLKLLLPMVSCLREIHETKSVLEEVRHSLKKENIPFNNKIDLGIMIEIPSAALMSDVFAREVEFLSFGTNDLTQYTLAVDRTNQKIARYFNDMHPAILRLMQLTIKNARILKKEISICGEMAANPEAIPLLLGLGLRKLSISPNAIPRIKKIIRMLDAAACKSFVDRVITLPSAPEIQNEAKNFIKENIADKDLLI